MPKGLVILAVLTATLAPAFVMAQSLPDHIQPAGSPTPFTFTRSGAKAVVAIPPVNLPSMELVLRAYGRVWMQRTAKNQKDSFRVEFDVPAVRVPTVFSVTHETLAMPELAQLVAFPDRDVTWDKKIALYSAGAAAWFEQWAAATGLPVKQVAMADLESAKLTPDDQKSRGLLILGRSAAGKELAEVAKIARDKGVNVLVLDAEWFGDSAGPVDVLPKHMAEGLSDIATQSWPHPLNFASHRQPWPGIGNRRAWIQGEKGFPLVLVEEVLVRHDQDRAKQAIVLSYVPWEQRLGRNESADQTLLALMLKLTELGVPLAPPVPSDTQAKEKGS